MPDQQPSPEPSSVLTSTSDDVLRRIGRNLLLFQQIEGLLKFLLVNSKAQGSVNEWPESQKRDADVIHKQTMGALVRKFADDVAC